MTDNRNGTPTWRMTPQAGCSCSTIIPRATASGDANAATMSLIGPHGISAASSAASQSAVDRDANRAASSGRRTARRSTRSPLVAKRGSPASDDTPSASHSRGHCRSDPTATAIAPSAVANVSYGTMFGCALPSRPGATPVDERVLRLVDEAGQRRAEQRHVDPLALADGRRAVAFATDERGEDRHRPEHPADDVADRDPDLGRSPAVLVGRPGDRHEPARRLDHEVVARPIRGRPDRAVARDRQVDEPRVERGGASRRRSPRRANPPTRKFSTSTSPSLEQPAQDGGALGALEVEPDAALVAVDRQVVGGGPRPVGRRRSDPRRPPAARRVTLGRLDLDDVGAEVAEEHRAVRPGQDGRAVDDPQAGERAGSVLGGHRRPMVTACRRPVR